MLEKSESYWWIFKINMQIGHFNVQHGKTKWRGEYLISPGWVWRTGQRARLLPLHHLTARLHQRGQVSLSLWRRLWSWSWCWCYKFGRVDVVFRVVKVLWESVGVVFGSLRCLLPHRASAEQWLYIEVARSGERLEDRPRKRPAHHR